MPVTPHQLKVGAAVYSADGHKLGELHRLVLRRSDLTLTHIVVDIGFLRSGRPVWAGGFGLDYDRVVPMTAVSAANDERVTLSLVASEFKDAPEYTVEAFEEPQDLTPGEFDIPDIVNRAQGLAALIGSTSNAWVVEKLNRPLDSVDIKEGTDVWRRTPHEKLGEVKRVLLSQPDGRAVAFVVRRGFLLTRDVILPARYLAELHDDNLRVDISDVEVQQLREYTDD